MNFKSLDLVLNRLENGIIIISEDLSVKYWNRWLESNTQIYKEDILDKDITKIFRGINRSVLERKIKSSLNLKIPTFYETSLSHTLFPIERHSVTSSSFDLMQLRIIIAPFDLEKREVVISLYDVSEIYELKHTLTKEIEKVSSFNDELWREKKVIQSNISLVKIDKNGRIIEVSEALLNMFEYEKERLIKSHISILFHTDIKDLAVEDMFLYIVQNQIWESEVLCLSKNKKSYWRDITAIPFLSDLGELNAATIIFKDISDKKRLEELAFLDMKETLFEHADEALCEAKVKEKKSGIPRVY